MDAQAWRDQFPLRAQGRDILNRHGQRFKFAGVNWYGASDVHHVVAGLSVRSLEGICEAVASMGFTVVRLPFSTEMLDMTETPFGAIDYTVNPALVGLTPLEVYDRVIDALGDVGVAVVVNNHTTLGSWSGGAEANGLWFREGCAVYTEDRWIADWLLIANRYADRPHVVGYDLRNEVRPTSYFGSISQDGPSWGTGDQLDWAIAAGDCARALASQEHLQGLIIVERMAWPQESLAKMLMPVPPWQAWAVPRDRIVLSLHMYAWSGPGAWTPKAFVGSVTGAVLHAADYIFAKALYGELDDAAFERQMDAEFGFCLDGNICPVWLSEFGADLRSEFDRRWFAKICKYLRRKDVDFAYWSLNVGQKPGTTEDEAYGLLTNDWQPRWSDARLCALRRLGPSIAPGSPMALLKRPSFHMGEGVDCTEAPYCHALALHPWCAPLPGPLVQWPDERRQLAPGVLPEARYLWVTLPGKDTDASLNASAARGDLAALKAQCLEGGYGGFALRGGVAHMKQASCEVVLQRLQDADADDAVLYVAEEVRLCAVWHAQELGLLEAEPESAAEAEPELSPLSAADAEWECTPGINQSGSALVEQSPGGREAEFVESCQQACLREGYQGFQLRAGEPRWAQLLTPAATQELRRRAGAASEPGESGPAGAAPSRSAARRLHWLEHALVRIGLEAHHGLDAFPGCNAWVLRGANLTQCRELCLREGFGGFALHRGDAYFRTAAAGSLRQSLVPMAGCIFYVLVCEELGSVRATCQFKQASARRAARERLLPSLYKLRGAQEAAALGNFI